MSVAKFAGCLLHENWSLWLHMYVICYFGEHMSCRSINIYYAIWIEKTTKKSCQNFSFSVKNSKNRFISRLIDGFERFFAGFSPVNRFKFKLIWIGQTSRLFLPLEWFCKPCPTPVTNTINTWGLFENAVLKYCSFEIP